MLVSILSSVLGLLMDGDISWVMDILISLRFFFPLFRVRERLKEEIQCDACSPFGFLQELPMSSKSICSRQDVQTTTAE